MGVLLLIVIIPNTALNRNVMVTSLFVYKHIAVALWQKLDNRHFGKNKTLTAVDNKCLAYSVIFLGCRENNGGYTAVKHFLYCRCIIVDAVAVKSVHFTPRLSKLNGLIDSTAVFDHNVVAVVDVKQVKLVDLALVYHHGHGSAGVVFVVNVFKHKCLYLCIRKDADRLNVAKLLVTSDVFDANVADIQSAVDIHKPKLVFSGF